MIAERVRGITPFLAMEVLERAQKLEREGASIIHLELGEPDFDTPECIRQAAFKALDEGQTHYTHSLGDVELREHLCAYYKRRYGVGLHPDQVLIFPGSSPAMMVRPARSGRRSHPLQSRLCLLSQLRALCGRGARLDADP